MKKTLFLALASSIFLAACTHNQTSPASESTLPPTQSSPAPTSDSITTSQESMVKSTKDLVMESPAAKTGTLNDVTGGSSTGTAYVLRQSNQLHHFVTAQLPDPPASEFYEGWLVNKTPSLSFFSTGKMEKQSDGTYALSYTSDQPYPGYDDVVITIEKIADDQPEDHILEGKVN